VRGVIHSKYYANSQIQHLPCFQHRPSGKCPYETKRDTRESIAP
jgi:hypothetical protein